MTTPPRAPRMVLRRAAGRSKTEDATVTTFRPDGWPLCPWCGEDELAAGRVRVAGGTPMPADIDRCYTCGPVEVVTFEPADVSER